MNELNPPIMEKIYDLIEKVVQLRIENEELKKRIEELEKGSLTGMAGF